MKAISCENIDKRVIAFQYVILFNKMTLFPILDSILVLSVI